MDRRRYLTCPPDEDENDMDNPFLKLPPYQYIQPTFKTFSDDEVKRQAGVEALPKVPVQIQNSWKTKMPPRSRLVDDEALQKEIDDQFPPPKPVERLKILSA